MTLDNPLGLKRLFTSVLSDSIAPRFTLCQGMTLNASHIVNQQHELASSWTVLPALHLVPMV